MPSSYPLHQLRPPFCSTILNGDETSVPPVPPLHHHNHYPDQNKIDLCGRGTLGKFRLLCGKVFIPFFPLFFSFFLYLGDEEIELFHYFLASSSITFIYFVVFCLVFMFFLFQNFLVQESLWHLIHK